MTPGFHPQPSGFQMIDKDPGEALPYGLNWIALGYLQGGDTIISCTVDPAPGLTIGAPSIGNAGNVTMVTISGGVVGTIYLVTFRAITATGLTPVRTFQVRVIQR